MVVCGVCGVKGRDCYHAIVGPSGSRGLGQQEWDYDSSGTTDGIKIGPDLHNSITVCQALDEAEE